MVINIDTGDRGIDRERGDLQRQKGYGGGKNRNGGGVASTENVKEREGGMNI